MPVRMLALRYFSRARIVHWGRRDSMSRRDGVLWASRTLAVLLTVWVLVDLSYLPGTVHSFLRYN